MNKSKKHIFKAAVYVRLSKEDGDVADARKAESNSISNQKSLILNYLKDKHDIKVVSVFEDDVYTGTNFERPGFQSMIQDIHDGKIDCIVVKDLSRFGREYIGNGRYIERLFPAIGVRFIAINDNYDSLNSSASASNEIVIPFKNLINDFYCRDISIKIRSHLEVRRENGDYVGNYCPYGYIKDKTDKHKLMPDDYAGHVVQDIFSWILEGVSLGNIARKLNALGVKSPMEYKKELGIDYKTSFKKNDVAEWSDNAVRRIATNPIYIGTLIQGKVSTPSYKLKTKVALPKEKWTIVEDVIEPLITKRDFRIVQRLLNTDMRTAPGQNGIYLLSGLAFCGDCGALMARKCSTVNGKKYVYYMCSNYKKYKTCTPHRIKEEILEKVAAEVVRERIAQLLKADELCGDMNGTAYRIDIRNMQEHIKANETEIEKYNGFIIKAYTDFKEGMIDKKDYLFFKANFEKKKNEAETAIQRINDEINALTQNDKQNTEWIETLRKHQNIETLNRTAAVTLIKAVKVYEKMCVEVILDCDDDFRKAVESQDDSSLLERRAL